MKKDITIRRKRKILIETNNPYNREFFYNTYFYNTYYEEKYYIYSEDEQYIYTINEDVKNWPKTRGEVYDCFSPLLSTYIKPMYLKIPKVQVDYLIESGYWEF